MCERRTQDGGAIVAARFEDLAAHYKNRVVLSSRSSISVASSLEAVDVGGGFAGDGGGAVFVARAARAFGIARDRNARHVGQVLVEPAAALRQRLRMAADALDLRRATSMPPMRNWWMRSSTSPQILQRRT